MILDPVALNDIVYLLALIYRGLVCRMLFESSGHPENPISCLASQILSMVNTGLINSLRLLKLIVHGFAQKRNLVTNAFIGLGLLHIVIICGEYFFEVNRHFVRIYLATEVHLR